MITKKFLKVVSSNTHSILAEHFLIIDIFVAGSMLDLPWMLKILRLNNVFPWQRMVDLDFLWSSSIWLGKCTYRREGFLILKEYSEILSENQKLGETRFQMLYESPVDVIICNTSCFATINEWRGLHHQAFFLWKNISHDYHPKILKNMVSKMSFLWSNYR